MHGTDLPSAGQHVRVRDLLEPVRGPELVAGIDFVVVAVDGVDGGGQAGGTLGCCHGGQAEERGEGEGGEVHGRFWVLGGGGWVWCCEA